MMALRLKKDVQKASYYVWFLGAQEAKELRGDRVLTSTIPRLIQRSVEQEPLKVTLQISHKGLKIIQGSAKHFIPHNAITCSLQMDDIVACVLLLYNPTTKCPLHVHAYRCDSDITAQVLHEQLQILIKTPENQKRFADLELKLEKSLKISETEQQIVVTSKKESGRFDNSSRRFDSSVGSETGTSTRESECSEEQNSPELLSPVIPVHLYDSLAAELRAKLKGNGPPLLLPPRDYDTVHRSQGNLAAIELRRCQNSYIVGSEMKSKLKQRVISSHGSSGIGSDLAPSPERHEQNSTSSSDDYHQDRMISLQPGFKHKSGNIKLKAKFLESKMSAMRYEGNPPSYIYPKEPRAKQHDDDTDIDRYRNRNESNHYREEEIVKPIINIKSKKNNFSSFEDDRRKHNEVIEKPVRAVIEVERKSSGGLMRQQSERYRQAVENIDMNIRKYRNGQSSPSYERENLTDRQKYREILESRDKYYKDSSESPPVLRHAVYRGKERELVSEVTRELSPDLSRSIQRKSKSSERYRAYEHDPVEYQRNPYREPESLPYRESIESMIKSPVMQYKSRVKYDDVPISYHSNYKGKRRSPSPTDERYNREMMEQINRKNSGRNQTQTRHLQDASPISTMKRTSPKDRFQDAKEKFQAMEQSKQQVSKPILTIHRAEPQQQYERDYRQTYSPEQRRRQNVWSSEEDLVARNQEYRSPPNNQRYPVVDRRVASKMLPAKSLSNLTKGGYRHSYAEQPMKYCNRVGLAAVVIDPF